MTGFNGIFSSYLFKKREKPKITLLSIKIEVDRVCKIASLIFS